MVIRQYRMLGFVLAAGVLVAALPAFAGTIVNVDSNPALNGASEFNNLTGTDMVVPDLDPFWAPNSANSSWISYADTGTAICSPGNSNPAPCPGNSTTTGTPNAVFTLNFDLPNADNVGSITVWADDTAAVYLDGTLLIPANPNLGLHCANAPVGCEAIDGATFNFPGTDSYTGGSLNLGAGEHTLTIDAYQLGGGPFGVMYEGSFNSSPSTTPEPASYALLGLGLAGLGLLARRKRA